MTAVDLAVGIGVILLVCWWPIEGEERRGAFTWPFRSGASNLAS